MIGIKGTEIPKSCYDCDFCCAKDDYYCAISKKRLARKVIDIPNKNRSSDCPLVEIVTCKDCKYYFIDEDGCGYHCEKSDTERIPTCADFYCIHAERRE